MARTYLTVLGIGNVLEIFFKVFEELGIGKILLNLIDFLQVDMKIGERKSETQKLSMQIRRNVEHTVRILS